MAMAPPMRAALATVRRHEAQLGREAGAALPRRIERSAEIGRSAEVERSAEIEHPPIETPH
jgi:hypothetical protein